MDHDDQEGSWEEPEAKSIAKVWKKPTPAAPAASPPKASPSPGKGGSKLKPRSKLKSAVHAVSLRPQSFGLGKTRKPGGSAAQAKTKAQVEKDRHSRDGKKVSKPGKGGKLNADGSLHHETAQNEASDLHKDDPNYVEEEGGETGSIPPLTFTLEVGGEKQAQLVAQTKQPASAIDSAPKKDSKSEGKTGGFSKLSAAIRGRRSRETYVKMAKEKRLWAPYVETGPEVVKEMLDLANTTANDVVVDLGAGDGRICISAAKDYGARCA
jgi:hypothetical protein